MKSKRRDRKQNQFEHSIPGSNQAGKRVDLGEKDQIEEHSLPGTNQAGKEADDRTNTGRGYRRQHQR
jgi:hypothetical protein